MADSIRLGTRGSALALAQAGGVARALEAQGVEVELVAVRTSGDEPAVTEDKSRFVKELEQALLAGEIDLAVHSAKDVPSELPDGLAIVAVPERADPRDALCLAPRLAAASGRATPGRATPGRATPGRATPGGAAGTAATTTDGTPRHSVAARPLDPLPEGAVVGTASLRRRSQLLALRPDLTVVELRGNVDTRLRKLAGDTPGATARAASASGAAPEDSGGATQGAPRRLDAIVLATAGLVRLDRADAGEPLPEDTLVPSAGQGCLALEGRDDDVQVRQLAERLTDPVAQARIAAERTVVAALEATCNTPVGVHATIESGELLLRAYVGSADGAKWIREELRGGADEPHMLGLEVANRLLTAGGSAILAAAEADTRKH